MVSILLKNMKVNGDEYSQYMGKYNMFQTTNQTVLPSRNEHIEYFVAGFERVLLNWTAEIYEF